MRTRPVPRTFAGGELAPWLDGITNEVTAQGARTLQNWLVMKQGPITRRPGTFHVEEARGYIERGDCENTSGPVLAGTTAVSSVDATFARSSAQKYAGSYSRLCTKTNAAGDAASISLGGGSTSNLHGCVPGETYTFHMKAYIPSGAMLGTECRVILRDYVAAWENSNAYGVNLYNQWQDISVEKTIRAGSTAVDVLLYFESTASSSETYYVDDLYMHGDGREAVLIPITIDDDNSYVIELGHEYARFYKDHVQISSAGTAYEVETPWSAGDVTDLRWTYIPDLQQITFTHPNHRRRNLIYTSAASWALTVANTIACRDVYLSDVNGKIYRTNDWDNASYDSPPSSANQHKHPIVVPIGDRLVMATQKNTGASTNLWAKDYDAEAWSEQTSPSYINTAFNRCLAGDRSTTAIMVSNTSTALISNDGGLSFISKALPNSTGYYCIGYDSSTDDWRIFGSNNAYSEDGGDSWTSIAGGIVTSGILPIDCVGGDDMWLIVSDSTRIYTANSIAGMALAVSIPGYMCYSVAYNYDSSDPVWLVEGKSSLTHTIYITNNRTTFSIAMSQSFSGVRRHSLSWFPGYFVLFDPDAKTLQISDDHDGRSWTTQSFSDIIKGRAGGWTSYNLLDDQEWFDADNHYPAVCCLNDQRLILGHTNSQPSTLWGGAIGKFNNFYIGEFADEGWSYEILGDRNVDIQWIVGGQHGVIVGTRTMEGILTGASDEGMTPSSANMQWLSTFGSAGIQPVRVGGMIVFAQRGGEIIRGLIPSAGDQAYKSPDLTQYADHIAEGGVVEFDHQDDPQTIVWAVRGDGTLLALTLEGNTIAWSRIVTDGDIESVAVVPTSGAEDEIWAVVKRDINGYTHRFIEYFDTLKVASKESAHYVDCGYENAAAASATIFANVMPWMAGETVDVLVNGNTVEHVTISSSGTLTITTPGATHIHAGMPYISYAQTMRMETGSPWGTGQGLSKKGSGNLLVWVHDAIGGEFGPEMSITEAVAYDSSSDLTTDLLEVNYPGTWDRDGYVWCIQRDPLPMTIVAIAPDIEVGDR